MNLRHLADFFRGKTSAEYILNEIAPEVENFRNGFGKKGSSLPVYVTEDDFNFILEPEHVKLLCNMYLKGSFSEWHIQYISNLIELAASFSSINERVEEAIFQMADPEINFPLTPETVKKICDGL